jgi:hypothetical protein
MACRMNRQRVTSHAESRGDVSAHFTGQIELVVRCSSQQRHHQVFHCDQAAMQRIKFGVTGSLRRLAVLNRCRSRLRFRWAGAALVVPSGQRSLTLQQVVSGIRFFCETCASYPQRASKIPVKSSPITDVHHVVAKQGLLVLHFAQHALQDIARVQDANGFAAFLDYRNVLHAARFHRRPNVL